MYQQGDHRTGGQSPPFFSAEFAMRWLHVLLDAVMRMVSGGDRPEGIDAGAPSRPRPAMPAPSPRRSIVGFINTGIYKVEQARRSAAIARQYRNTLRTIKLTRHAIRRAPRRSRSLFSGYYRVLHDARRRVKLLHRQLQHTEAHIRGYNPYAIEDEIRILERRLAAAPEGRRTELELMLESRRQLLDSVLTLHDRLESLAAQLNSISSALELNHIRIVAITGRAGYSTEAATLTFRMEEVTEQIMLLEESLRELDEEG